MQDTPATLPEIIDRIIAAAEPETVSLRRLVESFGRASFTPVLLLPALAVATPLSGIPLFSSLMGVMIALVAVQMLLRRRHLWLPDWILRREISGARVRSAFERLKPVGAWIDRRTTQRFKVITRRPLIFIPQLICVLSGVLMPPLEFVPFSSSVVGIGVAFLALGMLTRDGVVTLIALLPYGLVGWLVLRVI